MHEEANLIDCDDDVFYDEYNGDGSGAQITGYAAEG